MFLDNVIDANMFSLMFYSIADNKDSYIEFGSYDVAMSKDITWISSNSTFDWNA